MMQSWDMFNAMMDEFKETIHSGHFMVSDIDDSEAQDETDSVSVPVPDAEDRGQICPQVGFDFENACKETSKTYRFGPRSCKSISIDATLTKLFQCMTLAYSGKLTSPRWKNFKGMKLRWKDKIRLNNVIWRAWHMQFVKRQKPVVCQFASPLDGDTHNKPEAVVIEGKYWKRRLDTVCAEYKKWRLFYKNKFGRLTSGLYDEPGDLDFYNWQPRSNQSCHSSNSMITDEDPFMDFNDTLFSCLIPNQPFAFPNPREIAKAGIADFIQPGLVQLQPNLDDFMDTLDFLPSRLPPVPEEHSDDCTLQEFLNNTIFHSSQGSFDFLGSRQRSSEFSMPSSVAINKVFGSTDYSVNQQLFPNRLPERKIETATSTLMPLREEASIQNVAQLSCVNNTPSMSRQLISPTNSPPSLSQPLLPVGSPTSLVQSQHQTSPPRLAVAPSPTNGSILNTNINTGVGSPGSPPQQLLPSPPQNDNLFLASSSLSMPPPAKQTGQKFVNILPATTSPPSAASQQLMTALQPQASQQLLSASSSTLIVQQPTFTTESNIVPNILQGGSSTPSQGIPNTTKTDGKQDVFIMPKGKSRIRSRSMSGPQCSTSASTLNTGSSVSNALPNSTNIITTTTSCSVLPQNALLARLLTSGTYLRTEKSPPIPAVNNSTVAIITTVACAQPTQTVVISPVTLTSGNTMSFPVNDLSNQILQGTPAQVLNNVSPKMPISCCTSTPFTTTVTVASGQPSSISSSVCSDSRSSLVKSYRPKSETDRVQYREHRRVCHINAEQKRRCNIKNGFDTLHSLIPSLSQNPNAKVSKAAMLQKAGEYIMQLRAERAQLQEEADMLRKQIESLNQAINVCQSQLPATGVPISRQNASKLRDMFDEYVRKRTLQNWKFWIFSILIQPLLDSYNNTVSTASIDNLCRTALTWLEQHCSLVALRPAVLNSLRYLSTSTNILSDPTKIAEEATQAVSKRSQSGQ